MPDFERVFDQLSIDLANSDEKKQYAIGFIDGKKKARIEVLIIVVSLYFLIAMIGNLFNT